MNAITKLSLFLTLTLSAVILSAQSKPNLTGTWVLNVSKSDLGGAPVTAVTAQVEHHDPVLKYSVKGTADGQGFEETETLTTDGKPSTDSHGNQIIARWDGGTLAVDINNSDGSPLYQARLTLSADGKNLTRDFVGKSAGDTQKRHEIYDKQ